MSTPASGYNTSPYKGKGFDALLSIRDTSFAALTTASANRVTFAWEGPYVSSAVAPIDMGNARVNMKAVIDISAMDIVSNDEEYCFTVLGYDQAATGYTPLASLSLGAKEITLGTVDNVPGRYEILFSNDFCEIVYPKLTLGVMILGTTPSLQFTAFFTPLDH
jgi:hypothetical protein